MSRLATRLLLGALAGLTGTAAMTACMARLHQALPVQERYPLPPREITGALAHEARGERRDELGDWAVAAHFGFGAVAGALLSALRFPARPLPMAAAGVGVWAASYFGWVPALGILTPAHRHPARRNALMSAVHLVWGAVAALTLSELHHARRTMFAPGPLQDRPA
ncbi:hypothetical protein [Phenylobacterium sp.]|uniref:hypothetical protein n=1 Tax=Phenylobacterium sp. TaxID=1871053 RepID=UPI0035B2CE80